MQYEYNFSLTAKANAAAAAQSLQSVRFTVLGEMPQLMVGDLFSSEESMPLVFIITRRHFHFVAPDHVQVDILLDIPPG